MAVSNVGFSRYRGWRRQLENRACRQILADTRSTEGRLSTLIGAAAELATGAGITGWQAGDAMHSASTCYQNWLRRRGCGKPFQVEAAVREVRRFIQVNGSKRFQIVRSDEKGVLEVETHRQIGRDRAGFVCTGNGNGSEYLIFSEVFRNEVCKGLDWMQVARALADRGWLRGDGDHFTVQRRLPGLGRTRVYVVSASILDHGCRTPINDGSH